MLNRVPLVTSISHAQRATWNDGIAEIPFPSRAEWLV
jgi:hypothetical protein